jgi:hypothetical protein
MNFFLATYTRDNLWRNLSAVNETDTLKGLIDLARRKRDKSIRQMAFEAQAAGHKIVGTTLSGIEKGTYKSVPSDETIRAIGWLAGVGDEVSFAAAGRTRPGPPFAEELPPGVDDLAPRERRVAIDLLRTLVAMRQELNQDARSSDDSTSTAQPGAPGEAEHEIEEVKPDGLIPDDQGRRLGSPDDSKVPGRGTSSPRRASKRAKGSKDVGQGG